MKEKRYFNGKAILPIIYAMVSVFICSLICYSTLTAKFENELNSYSEDEYHYLSEIADKVVQEKKGINLLALPDNVARYTITTDTEKGIVEFEYYLDNNKGMRFAEPSSMKVSMSKETLKVISKTPNCSSKEDYVQKVRFKIASVSALSGIISTMFVRLIGYIFTLHQRKESFIK